ncbi:RTA1 domain protein [Aspergillus flavus AF70]|nr:RTA1 domain protein [Aspergillus flavus AF70]
MGYQYYHYDPSSGAAVSFAAVFGLTTVIHIWQMIRTRTWYLTPFVIGGIFEAIGYLCRFISATETPNWTMKPYVGQSLLLLLAPALFAASVYMILGRIIRMLNAGSISLIRPSWLTKIFVTGDVLSFLVQSGGGGMLAKANSQDSVKLGENMIIGGLFIQIIFFGFFIVVAIVFHRRMLSTPMHHMVVTEVPWNQYMKILYTVSILIMIRSIYRVAEYVQGSSGYLQSKEAFIYVFDAALMFACCIILNWWHPSKIVSSRKKVENSGDHEMLNNTHYDNTHNPESQAINTSRGKESRHDDTPDTRSVQSPISNQFGPTSEKHEGEEPSTTTEQVHNDPSKSPEEKRKNVEQAGRRPMGPEDEK